MAVKNILKNTILFAPLVLGSIWIGFILFEPGLPKGEMLSPAPNRIPLIVSLILFLLGYSLFLLFLFSDSIREFFLSREAVPDVKRKKRKK